VEPPQGSGWKSARPVLLTTLVPVAAALGFFALATYGKKSADPRAQPSMAAFDACLTEHGLQPAGAYPSQFDETVAAQQQMKMCGDKIPKQVLQKAQDERRAAMSSYRECLDNLGGSRRPSVGRFRGGFSQSRRDALVICRSLLQNGGGGGGQATTPKKKAAPPVA
jgi:hypothetical protein